MIIKPSKVGKPLPSHLPFDLKEHSLNIHPLNGLCTVYYNSSELVTQRPRWYLSHILSSLSHYNNLIYYKQGKF